MPPILPPKTLVCHDHDPMTTIQHKNKNNKNTEEEEELERQWMVCHLTILKVGIREGNHRDCTIKLFEQCYIFFMPMQACMQQIHLIAIKYSCSTK